MSSSNASFQCTLFDDLFDEIEEEENVSAYNLHPLDQCSLKKLENYNLAQYTCDIESFGVKKTWNDICSYILENCNAANEFLKNSDLGQLYEMGLAIEDKNKKKSSGQYYTPDDVASVLSDWFDGLEGENVCDVACGTGNLVLNYLERIGKEKAEELIAGGHLYLYDSDETALQICKTAILLKYGVQYKDLIHDFCCDFLDRKVRLPEHCKVISNPPYAKIENISYKWAESEVVRDSKEFYASFIEKIIRQSEKSVIITPYSFMGGGKFYSLRKIMNNYNGFIVSFDNVPGNIFAGRKFGIFNTNTSNSVRAAITVVENKPKIKGFRTSHFIRFKNIEREKLLNTKTLETFLSDEYQIVSNENPMYFKSDNELSKVYKTWKEKSSEKLFDYVTNVGSYLLSVPNTCRYTTVASSKELSRSGQIVLRFADKDFYNFAYCLINSSFAYWYWRLFDGGITYQKGLLLSLPIFYDLLNSEDKRFFENTSNEMQKLEEKCIVTKNNVGVQENLKFPKSYRDKINQKIFDILEIAESINIFDRIHSNMALEIEIGE